VFATYEEIMSELRAMMAAGGKQTARMTALETQMSVEVKLEHSLPRSTIV
jgi:hypothetical protein